MKRIILCFVATIILLLGVSGAAAAYVSSGSPTSTTVQASGTQLAAFSNTPWDSQVTSFLSFVGGCAGVNAGGWTSYREAVPQAEAIVLVLAAVGCGVGIGATLGTGVVGAVCWQSQRWWGAGARTEVWILTFGKYTRC